MDGIPRIFFGFRAGKGQWSTIVISISIHKFLVQIETGVKCSEVQRKPFQLPRIFNLKTKMSEDVDNEARLQ